MDSSNVALAERSYYITVHTETVIMLAIREVSSLRDPILAAIRGLGVQI